jgi:hypothetical protein
MVFWTSTPKNQEMTSLHEWSEMSRPRFSRATWPTLAPTCQQIEHGGQLIYHPSSTRPAFLGSGGRRFALLRPSPEEAEPDPPAGSPSHSLLLIDATPP